MSVNLATGEGVTQDIDLAPQSANRHPHPSRAFPSCIHSVIVVFQPVRAK